MNPPVLHVEDLLSALARKGIPLPFEMGAFLVLQTTEQILARKPREPITLVSPATVWLNDDGEVVLADARPASDETAACKALVELLGALLVRSAPGVPTMLLELVERGPSDGAWTLSRLRDDLEAALLPLNRSATRRVLSRLLREVRREGERGARGPAPDARAVDRDVDVLFGVQAPAEADTAAGVGAEPQGDTPIEVDVEDPPAAAQPRTRGQPTRARAQRRALPDLPESDTLAGSPSPAATLDDFEREVDDGQGRTGMRLGIALVIGACLLVAAYFAFARASG